MGENTFLKRRWKLLLNVATCAALLLLIYAIRDQLAETFHNLARVNAWALFALLPIQVLNYHAQTKMYQGLFSVVGNKLRYKFLVKTSLELNFVNHVFPSGGVSGISYFGARMRSDKITGGKATLVQLMKLLLQIVSFELLLILGLLSLAISGQVNDFVMLVAGSLSTLMVVGTIGFVYLLGSKQRISIFFTGLTKFLNRAIQIIRPKHPETINMQRAEGLFEELHVNYKLFKVRWRELKAPFWYAFLANLTEVLAVYVVFLAFDHVVNIGAVILAYAVANFAGLISVLPGGVGIYEALMATVLATAGVPAAVSLPVIVMYRVLNTLIQLPVGYVFYHKSLNKAPESSADHHDES